MSPLLLQKKTTQPSQSVSTSCILRLPGSRRNTQLLVSDASGFTGRLNSHGSDNWKGKLKSACYKGRLGGEEGGRKVRFGLGGEAREGASLEVSTQGCQE